jgi:hypothetical protein
VEPLYLLAGEVFLEKYLRRYAYVLDALNLDLHHEFIEFVHVHFSGAFPN